MSRRILTALSPTLIGLAIFACSVMQCRAGGKLIIDGADLFDPLVQRHITSYSSAGDSCPFHIRSSTTGKGLEAFINGNADLVMASRKMNVLERKKAAERRVAVSERLVGSVGLALVTSLRNPVNALTIEQLRKIFSGEYTNWQQVGGLDERIRILTRAVPETGAGVLFQNLILHGAPYGTHAEVVSSYRLTMVVCSRATDGLPIGYIPTSSAYFSGLEKLGVKLVRLKEDENSPAIAPTKEALLANEYPIMLPFYMYWNGQSTATKCLTGLAEFVASRELERKPAGTRQAANVRGDTIQ